ncbi:MULTISPECIES: hypothetical protein [unclassified Bradyrhizobium]|uniref:hypothetical protein n=1 Tax=Bradyrhizobium sp. USDA 4541 TaxID=2817704 RepID=UPI0020A55801|nr:hypothetical protein [Bradyrhizobium sp. USDA 4541]MCP1848373.1 hypothetical protein [Bradyrhizobium sp. USDA 4541]
MKTFRCAILGFTVTILLSASQSIGQTLPQTAAYILSGGIVEVKDMKTDGDDTVYVPSFMIGLTNMIPAMAVHVSNRERCEITFEPVKSDQVKRVSVYFNNVIPTETRNQLTAKNQLQSISTFYLIGEEQVVCAEVNGNKGCSRTLDTPAYTENLPRVYKAIDYLFSKFCSPSRRKGAF